MAEQKDAPYIVVERQSSGVSTFLWGALLGAGLALLFAPRSGKETRREIGEGIRKLRNSAEDTMHKMQKAVTGTIEELRDQVNERMEAARQAMEAGREAALRSRAELERRVQEARAAQRSGRPFAAEIIDEEIYTADEEPETREI